MEQNNAFLHCNPLLGRTKIICPSIFILCGIFLHNLTMCVHFLIFYICISASLLKRTPWSSSDPTVRWLLMEVVKLGRLLGWQGPCREQPGLDLSWLPAQSILHSQPEWLFSLRKPIHAFSFPATSLTEPLAVKGSGFKTEMKLSVYQNPYRSGPNTLNNWWTALFL